MYIARVNQALVSAFTLSTHLTVPKTFASDDYSFAHKLESPLVYAPSAENEGNDADVRGHLFLWSKRSKLLTAVTKRYDSIPKAGALAFHVCTSNSITQKVSGFQHARLEQRGSAPAARLPSSIEVDRQYTALFSSPATYPGSSC